MKSGMVAGMVIGAVVGMATGVTVCGKNSPMTRKWMKKGRRILKSCMNCME